MSEHPNDEDNAKESEAYFEGLVIDIAADVDYAREQDPKLRIYLTGLPRESMTIDLATMDLVEAILAEKLDTGTCKTLPLDQAQKELCSAYEGHGVGAATSKLIVARTLELARAVFAEQCPWLHEGHAR